MKLKLMSYNTQHCLNFITREIDFDMVVNTIRYCGADIVGLQEVRDEGELEGYQAQTRILAEKLGFYGYFAQATRLRGNNPYGNALLSRYPILEAQVIPIPDPEVRGYDGYYETRCILKAKLDVPGGLTVLNTHFGLNPDEKLSAVKTVVANLPERRLALMGDFNMQPDNPKLTPIFDRLYDTADKFSAPKGSYPSDNPGKKIDYILVSRDLTVHNADIPEIVSSDHRPHLAEIEV